MGNFRNTLLLGAFISIPAFNSCAPSGEAAFISRTASAANGRIMHVRQDIQTLGFLRLTALSRLYPDLGLFISRQGVPDFLAETSKGENHYLVLYYLDSRKAFACRSGSGGSNQIEFSGPYPITSREFQTLENLRKKSESES